VSPAQQIIELRRGTASQWTTANPVLHAGEPGFEIDTGKLKIGDGTTAWTSLAYTGSGAAGQGVATGGTTGQVLKKNSGTNFDTSWVSAAVPAGGTTGQVLGKSSGTDYATAWVDQTGGTGDVAASTHAATSKTTPADADELPLSDSAATFGLKKLTIANLKALFDSVGVAKLKTARNIDGQAFDGTANVTVIAPGTHAATSKTTPATADEIPIVDTAASNVLKRLTIANLKTFILGTAVPTATLDDQAVNKAQMDAADESKLDADPSQIGLTIPGYIINVPWDAAGSTWHPTNYTAQAADPNIGFHFTGGTLANPPFAVARPLQPWTVIS
jgi:hypothetical protein